MKKEPAIVLANAIIWGTVIIATSLRLKGTDMFPLIQHILGGGAAASLFVTSLCVIKKKPKEQGSEKE